jgi:hypothetical protein
MLFSTVFLFALCVSRRGSPGWGSVGEVAAASFRPAFEGQMRHAVIGTRVGQNKRSSPSYLKQRQRRTAHIASG